MGHEALIIFVKEPQLGKVKTRLAATIGDITALDIYQRLLAHTDSISAGFERYIFVDGDPIKIGQFDQRSDHWVEQQGEDLGARMLHAFDHVLSQGHKKAVIIGSDCADLTNEHIRSGFDRIGPESMVIGPALDGGYYLLGLDKPYPELFQKMTWSNNEVASCTIKRATKLGLDITSLEKLRDIDTEDDLMATGWNG